MIDAICALYGQFKAPIEDKEEFLIDHKVQHNNLMLKFCFGKYNCMMEKIDWIDDAALNSAFLLRALQQLVMADGENKKMIKLEKEARKILIELRKLEKNTKKMTLTVDR